MDCGDMARPFIHLKSRFTHVVEMGAHVMCIGKIPFGFKSSKELLVYSYCQATTGVWDRDGHVLYRTVD